MQVRDVLFEVAERGITLTCGRTEDRLNAKPTAALNPELVAELKEHKAEIIKAMREDEEMRRTGTIQSERQVFEMAREHFGLNGRGGAREARAQASHQSRVVAYHEQPPGGATHTPAGSSLQYFAKPRS